MCRDKRNGQHISGPASGRATPFRLQLRGPPDRAAHSWRSCPTPSYVRGRTPRRAGDERRDASESERAEGDARVDSDVPGNPIEAADPIATTFRSGNQPTKPNGGRKKPIGVPNPVSREPPGFQRGVRNARSGSIASQAAAITHEKASSVALVGTAGKPTSPYATSAVSDRPSRPIGADDALLDVVHFIDELATGEASPPRRARLSRRTAAPARPDGGMLAGCTTSPTPRIAHAPQRSAAWSQIPNPIRRVPERGHAANLTTALANGSVLPPATSWYTWSRPRPIASSPAP